jgi:hypothetical protein
MQKKWISFVAVVLEVVVGVQVQLVATPGATLGLQSVASGHGAVRL